MTEIQLENGFLNLPENVNFPITISFNDLKDGSRSGGYSKTIELDGDGNNAKLLGYYFDIDLSSNDFDRNAKTEATVLQNGSEVFTGYIQLMEIKRINEGSNTGKNIIKYVVSVFDEVSNFFIEMGEKELSDLSFPELTHVFNRANIIDSWDNLSGFVYPIFAKNGVVYTLKDFKPAIYELDYLKKIFEFNGYTFTFDEFQNSTIRFDKRIIPFNGEGANAQVISELKEQYTVKGEGSYSGENEYFNVFLSNPAPLNTYLNAITPLTLTELQDTQNQWLTNTYDNKAGNNTLLTTIAEFDYSVNIKAKTLAGNDTAFFISFDPSFSQVDRIDFVTTLIIRSKTNENTYGILNTQVIASYNANTSFSNGYSLLASGQNASSIDVGEFDLGEDMEIVPVTTIRQYYNNQEISTGLVRFSDGTNDVYISLETNLTNVKAKITPNIEELQKGSIVNVDGFIPKNVKQKDLISSIAKSYNLILIPSKDTDKEIKIVTRDKYYSDGELWDWTDKIAEDQENNIEFLSNKRKKKQTFAYKEDKDFVNEGYQEKHKETYGKSSITLDNEYTLDSDKTELIYSPTPSIKSGLSFPLPSINGITPKNNIRILLNNGKKTTWEFPFYDSVLPTGNAINTGFYLDTSMFDNDAEPNFSICFDAPKTLFHSFQNSQTSNYLYNLHYQNEVSNINEGETLTAYFNLNEGDFQRLSKLLNWKIYIKDNGYFFVSSVQNYNANKTTLTKVVLITADDSRSLKFIPQIGTNTAGPLDPFLGGVGGFLNGVNDSTNTVFNSTNVAINGLYNFVSNANNVSINGDLNTILASNVQVVGSQNLLKQGSESSKIIGDNGTFEKPNIYINNLPSGQNGDVLYKADISQVGTNIPVISEYINKANLTITASIKSAGFYKLSGFDGNLMGKIEFAFNGEIGVNKFEFASSPGDSNIFEFYTKNASGTPTNGILVVDKKNIITIYKYD